MTKYYTAVKEDESCKSKGQQKQAYYFEIYDLYFKCVKLVAT